MLLHNLKEKTTFVCKNLLMMMNLLRNCAIIYILRLFVHCFPVESVREASDLVRFFFGEPLSSQ